MGLLVVTVLWLIMTNAWEATLARFGGDLRYYFWAQMVIFWRYVALSVCPLPGYLNVDHAVAFRPYSLADADVLLSVMALALVVLVPASYLIRKRPVASFLLFAIPIGLAPYFVLTSAEAMVEYRFYLPLAALCGLAGMAAARRSRPNRGRGTHPDRGPRDGVGSRDGRANPAWRTDVSLGPMRRSSRPARRGRSTRWPGHCLPTRCMAIPVADWNWRSSRLIRATWTCNRG